MITEEMITEDYVSFETAKLLKEKGFNEIVDHCYDLYSFEFISHCAKHGGQVNAPTIQMAMKWLREEKHYYIQVMLDGWACGDHSGYYVVIQKTDSDFEMMLSDAVDEVFYQTYEEACEAGIKYCIENLI